MDQSQYIGLQASAGLGRASARLLGGVSGGPQNNVLSLLPKIAYRLIPKELESNGQYRHNLSSNKDLKKLRTLSSLCSEFFYVLSLNEKR